MFSESGLLNAVKNSYPSYNTRFCFKYVSMIKGTHAQSFYQPIYAKLSLKLKLGSDSNSTQRFSVLFSMG